MVEGEDLMKCGQQLHTTFHLLELLLQNGSSLLGSLMPTLLCARTHKSTSGYIFTMSGSPVCWSSKQQATVALSTTEVEYIALSRAAQQSRWMHLWCGEIGFEQADLAILKGDNLGSVHLTKTTKDHHQIKHIDICHHYLHKLCAKGKLEVQSI